MPEETSGAPSHLLRALRFRSLQEALQGKFYPPFHGLPHHASECCSKVKQNLIFTRTGYLSLLTLFLPRMPLGRASRSSSSEKGNDGAPSPRRFLNCHFLCVLEANRGWRRKLAFGALGAPFPQPRGSHLAHTHLESHQLLCTCHMGTVFSADQHVRGAWGTE